MGIGTADTDTLAVFFLCQLDDILLLLLLIERSLLMISLPVLELAIMSKSSVLMTGIRPVDTGLWVCGLLLLLLGGICAALVYPKIEGCISPLG